VLHNIARRAGDLLPPDDFTLQLPDPWENILQNGNILISRVDNVPRNDIQHLLINNYFQR